LSITGVLIVQEVVAMDEHPLQRDKSLLICKLLIPGFLLVLLLLGAPVALHVRVRPDAGIGEQRKPVRPRRVGPLWRLSGGSRAGHARGFLRFWRFWERFTALIWHLRPVPGAQHGLLAVRVTRYRGRPIDLPDGTHVERGARVAILHFQNHALVKHAAAGPWELLGYLSEDMRALAAWLEAGELPADIKAIYGITLLSRAAPRLGFTLRPRPRTFMAWFDRTFMYGLLILYHPDGQQRLARGTTYGDYPQEAWMSRREVLRRYHP
jgi:hypothetical protein